MKRTNYKLDFWQYKIIEAYQGDYGFALWVYRNRKNVYFQSGFGSVGTAEAYVKKYIIEHQFDIELD